MRTMGIMLNGPDAAGPIVATAITCLNEDRGSKVRLVLGGDRSRSTSEVLLAEVREARREATRARASETHTCAASCNRRGRSAFAARRSTSATRNDGRRRGEACQDDHRHRARAIDAEAGRHRAEHRSCHGRRALVRGLQATIHTEGGERKAMRRMPHRPMLRLLRPAAYAATQAECDSSLPCMRCEATWTRPQEAVRVRCRGGDQIASMRDLFSSGDTAVEARLVERWCARAPPRLAPG